MTTRPLKFTLEKALPDAQGTPRARAGRIELQGSNGKPHEILTPVFMPVGTVGSVKAMTTEEPARRSSWEIPIIFISGPDMIAWRGWGNSRSS